MRFEDDDRDAAWHGYERKRREVLANAAPDERVQRAIVGALYKKFCDAIFDFEHGIAVDACHIHCLGIQIASTIGIVQQSEAPALQIVPA